MAEITKDIGGVSAQNTQVQAVEKVSGFGVFKAAADLGMETYRTNVLTTFQKEVDQLTNRIDQDGLSTSSANTSLSAKVKELENKHPLLSKDIRKTVAGSAGARKGYFPQTAEEKLKEDLIKDQAKFEQDLKQEAFKAGFRDVDSFRVYNSRLSNAQLVKAETSAQMAAGKATSAIIFDNMEASITENTNNISAKVIEITKIKGGLTGEDIQGLKAAADQMFIGLQSSYRDAAGGDISLADKQAVITALRTERQALFDIIDNGSLQKVLSTDLGILEAVVKKGGIVNNVELASMAQFGETAVTTYLNTMNNPDLSKWIMDNDPRSGIVRNGLEASKYVSKTLKQIFGNGNPDELSKGENKATDVLTTKLMQDTKISAEEKARVGEYLNTRAEELGLDTMYAWDTDQVQRDVSGNKDLSKALKGTYNTVLANITNDLVVSVAGKNFIEGFQVVEKASDVKRPQRNANAFDRIRGTVKSVKRNNGRDRYGFVSFTPVPQSSGFSALQQSQGIGAKSFDTSLFSLPQQNKMTLLINLAERYPEEIRGGKSMQEWGDGLVKLLNNGVDPVDKDTKVEPESTFVDDGSGESIEFIDLTS